MSTPIFEAAPIPPKNPSGTEITRAQGHDTIRKMQALSIQSAKLQPNKSGGIRARRSALTVTIGV